MSELAALLTAIGSLVTAGGATFALVWNTLRNGPKERETAASRAVKRFVVAAEDGEITPDEVDEIRQELEGGDES